MSLPYRRKSVSRYLHRNFEAGFSGFRVKHGTVIVFLNTLAIQQLTAFQWESYYVKPEAQREILGYHSHTQ
jgi:hypothetical protein